MTTFEVGSTTAKGGFANEKAICAKFNGWKKDKEAQLWLRIMGYNPKEIDSVEAIQIPTRMKRTDAEHLGLKESFEELMKFKKTDAQLRILITIGKIIKVENLSLKKANSDADFNQVDKRRVDTYQEIWKFDNDVALGLKLFTGEINPASQPEIIKGKTLRDKRRMFIDELPESLRQKIMNFFSENRILVVSDILKGRGGLSANWMLVTKYNRNDDTTTWILKDINTVMNFFGSGDVRVSPKGSLYLGKLTVMRKGGTPDPTKLQFKINPCKLFELKK
ncbi:MAG: hypothetical protein QMD05_04220 [Candidatus Brocadiaceae bacterium]|nr:hypothetical protein [Candidatus Brocadiaceae bacterium]